MSVKNVVKVMNFYALLRVNDARKKVEKATEYELYLRKIISSIENNKVFKQSKKSISLNNDGIDLNIYLGSDYGFCSSFNSDVNKYILSDDPNNDKIIAGRKLHTNVSNVIFQCEKEKFVENLDVLYEIIFDNIINNKYRSINVIYIHYYNLNKQEIVKKKLLPLDSELDDLSLNEYISNDDYFVEGDLDFILWNLLVLYLREEIKIAYAWSWASENVRRQTFTNESLKKIDEREEEKKNEERIEKKNIEYKVIIEKNNTKNIKKRRSE